MSRTSILGVIVTAALSAGACASRAGDEGPAGEALGQTAEALAASDVKDIAQVYVKGAAGPLDFEGDYLPQVVCCENGGAPPEALKAQAVMARTYATYSYFRSQLGTSAKPLTGTTSDQAYYCAIKVSQACKDAVAATKGVITSFADTAQVAQINLSFFVDGPRPACLANKACACPKPSATTSMTPQDHPPDCACFTFASMGAANPAYVTYNWSKSGAAVTKSSIGGSDPANRGCASQNIQSCLSYAGWSYADMLRFFYGQDTVLRHLDGTPVDAPPGSSTSSSSSSGGTTSGGGGSNGSSGGDGAPTHASASGTRGEADEGGCSVGRGRSGHAGGVAALPLLALLAFARRARRLATP